MRTFLLLGALPLFLFSSDVPKSPISTSRFALIRIG
jgi:hypothetical protein